MENKNINLYHRYLVKRHNMIMEVYVLEISDTCFKFQNLVSEKIFWEEHKTFFQEYELIEDLGFYSSTITYAPGTINTPLDFEPYTPFYYSTEFIDNTDGTFNINVSNNDTFTVQNGEGNIVDSIFFNDNFSTTLN